MACPGNANLTVYSSNDYLYSQFYSSITQQNQSYNPLKPNSSRNCRKYKSFIPSFSPIINTLSTNVSYSNTYSRVYVGGSNFFSNGTTYINFGPFTNIPVTYYSSYNISFVVPLNAIPGVYNVVAVNIYNGNFSNNKNNTYPANLNYSNSLTYTIV